MAAKPRRTVAKKSAGKAGARSTTISSRAAASGRWSARVTRQSDALDLEKSVFKQGSARKIAASLKRSAEKSRRRKSSPYHSAMSMLTFYINRAGKNLSPRRRQTLDRAKRELRRQFGRD